MMVQWLELQVNYSGDIEYSTHVQNIGWQKFVKNGAMSGTTGQSLRLEAIKIRLTGEMAEKYDIYYRVHCQDFGWMGWAKNGESAGSAGYSYRLEGIEIVLLEKGGKAPGSTANAFSEKSTTTYVLNTRTKLFHKSTCPAVKNMSESNKIYTTDSRDIIVKEGYTACKDCKP